MEIVGYSDRLSVAPGQAIQFMVSSRAASYRARIVRLIHGDDNPNGPRFKQQEISTSVDGLYSGSIQEIRCGSYVTVDDDARLRCDSGLTIAAWIYPTTPEKGVQGIVTKWCASDQCGYGLFVDDSGCLMFCVGVGEGRVERVHASAALRRGEWYFVVGSYDAATGAMSLWQLPQHNWPRDDSRSRVATVGRAHRVGTNQRPLLMAANWMQGEHGESMLTGHYNGKIDAPSLYGRALATAEVERLKTASGVERDASDRDLLATWDLAQSIHSVGVQDASGHGFHGRTVNLPARAVTGHNWSGKFNDFKQAPQEYAAIHFHDDDLEDVAWKVDFELGVPDELASGVYAAWLTAAEGDAVVEEHVPFFVRPKRGTASASIVFLAPTISYSAYANHQFNNPDRIELMGLGDDVDRSCPRYSYLYEQQLLSTYDLHSDGSGVCYSSRLRPFVDIRPRHVLPPLSLGSGSPHQLNADLHIVDWLVTKGFAHDVVTDEDLHFEGAELLAPYRVLITGTHPEYWTEPMLDALEAFRDSGGRVMYLGGNGLYWVTSVDPERPHVIEVRRWRGTRSWDAKQGEYHHSTTGEIGGLWRFRNRAPQKLVGVGMIAQGVGENRPYRRRPDSFDPRATFIFEGIGADELIGDFPSLVYSHGAAGFEIDRLDHTLGTPAHALHLAASSDHSDTYQHAVEELLAVTGTEGGTKDPAVHADMVFFETANGGAVFSVGSISFCGCLSYDGYDNNVSRITENVLRRFDSPNPFV